MEHKLEENVPEDFLFSHHYLDETIRFVQIQREIREIIWQQNVSLSPHTSERATHNRHAFSYIYSIFRRATPLNLSFLTNFFYSEYTFVVLLEPLLKRINSCKVLFRSLDHISGCISVHFSKKNSYC